MRLQHCLSIIVILAGSGFGSGVASAQPANDDCSGAIPIPYAGAGAASTLSVDNTGATASPESTDPGPCPTLGAMSADLWYTWTPADDGVVTISLCDPSGIDTDLTVYAAGGSCASVGSATQVACSGDATSNPGPCQASYSEITAFSVTAGTLYTIRVGAWAAAGSFGVTSLSVLLVIPGAEICDDGLDNDIDGLTDCADTADCPLGTPPCMPPVNDECAQALVAGVGLNPIDSSLASDSSDPFDATTCPNTGLGSMSRDLWYTYTVAAGTSLLIRTCGIAGDTDVVIYEGSCGGLVQVGCNGNGCGTQSYAVVDASPGVTYTIRIGSWAADVGQTGQFDIVEGDPEICDDGLDNDLDQDLDCSDADCVGSGACVEICDDGVDNNDNGLVDCLDTAYCISGLPPCIEGLPGTCDDGLDNDADGLIDCADPLDCPTGVAPCLPPTNDECAAAIAVTLGTNPYDSTLASDSPDPLDACPTTAFWGSMSNDLWFSYTAASTTNLVAETCGSSHDTDLAIYDGSCGALVQIGCSGDACLLQSRAVAPVVQGSTVLIRLGSWGPGATGMGDLILSEGLPEICDDGVDNDFDQAVDCSDDDCACDAACPVVPAGDECCDAQPALLGLNPLDTTVNSDSSDPYSDALCPGEFIGQMSQDAWYSYTPSGNTLRVSTCNLAGDTDIVLYLGGDCDTLIQVDCNGDGTGCGFSSLVETTVTPGAVYTIRIGSWAASTGQTGQFEIADFDVELCSDGGDNDGDGLVDCADPDCDTDPFCTASNDLCPNAEVVFDGVTAFQTAAATTGTPPFTCGLNAGQDIWLRYTTTCPGNTSIDLAGTPFDTVLEVFDFSSGNCSTMTLIQCNDDSNGTLQSEVILSAPAGFEAMIRIAGYNGASGTGQLTVAPASITGFSGMADCATGDVLLTWDPTGLDDIVIRRDGVVIATLAAGTPDYLDLGLSTAAYDYEISGECSPGVITPTASTLVNVISTPPTDLIFRGELPAGVDSAAALHLALGNLGFSPITLDGGPFDYPCGALGASGVARVWILNGTFPAWRPLTLDDENALVTAQANGIGIYIESGDQWGFDGTLGVFGAIDGVDEDASLDGDDSFLAMDGADSALGLDTDDLLAIPYTQDNTLDSDWTDQLVPADLSAPVADTLGTDAAVIWRQSGGAYATGTYYSVNNGGGNVICQSWEFGGYGGDQTDLAGRYLEALGGVIGTGFSRGDCNTDGGFNIADAIFLLATLFSGGPSGTCADACDSNDDGTVNIADAIFALANLFSGGPTPAPPAPGSCGPDGTDTDALGCNVYVSCP